MNEWMRWDTHLKTLAWEALLGTFSPSCSWGLCSGQPKVYQQAKPYLYLKDPLSCSRPANQRPLLAALICSPLWELSWDMWWEILVEGEAWEQGCTQTWPLQTPQPSEGRLPYPTPPLTSLCSHENSSFLLLYPPHTVSPCKCVSVGLPQCLRHLCTFPSSGTGMPSVPSHGLKG